MELERSLLLSQELATCSNSEPDQSSPFPHPTFWRFILILSSHLYLGLPSVLFPSSLPTKTLYAPLLSPLLATCPAPLILLDVITRGVFGEEYRSLSSCLCNFLHSSVTLSLLGPNILRNCLFQTPSACVPPSMWATKFQTHTKQHAKL